MMICRVTLVASLLTCLSYCVLAAGPAVGAKATTQTATSTTTSAPAVKPLTITLDDKVNNSVGKFFTVIVGQIVEVRLDGMRMKTGWETGRIHGVLESANDEFVPMPEAPDPAMGTYVFRYKAAEEGQATLNFEYITPGGPGVTGRKRSAIVDRFTVVINVEESATSAPSQPTTASAPAVKPLVVTLADKGKTFTVSVGQTVEVRLDGLRMRTGWETSKVHGVLESANDEFVPMPEAPDPAMGTYVFRYKAAEEGQATLNFEYITPGGPAIKMRSRSAMVDQFKVVINVQGEATTAPSKPAPATPSVPPVRLIVD